MSRRRRGRRPGPPPDAFWGRSEDRSEPPTPIVPTRNPAAIPRSLGDPPLSAKPGEAQHHLSVVYEEAVKAATALAAANGLLDTGAGSDPDDAA